jgi:hypothetical protein
MKKRLMVAFLSGGLVAAMAPGAALGFEPPDFGDCPSDKWEETAADVDYVPFNKNGDSYVCIKLVKGKGNGPVAGEVVKDNNKKQEETGPAP